MNPCQSAALGAAEITTDGAGESKDIKFYLNGVALAATRGDAGTYTAMHNTPAKLFIGRDDLGSAGSSNFKYADGMIDEISIWNTELNSSEVKEIYYSVPKQNSGIGPTNLRHHSRYQDALVSWWRFGDAANDTNSFVTDLKSSNNLTGLGTPIAVLSGLTGAPTVTGSFDNRFVSHMIPRTEQQTRWITASII